MHDDFPRSGRDERVLTPGQLNTLARDLLESAFPLVWVEGELGNVTRPASGHLYFTLKDARAQVRCALFKPKSQWLRFQPREGLRVLARGRLTLYEARGDYQLVLDTLEEAGEGALRRAFEELKARLAAEGLFDAARKRPLPAFVRRLAVITSPTGAVIRDIASVLGRRFPLVEVDLLPAQVQGATAAAQIAAVLLIAITALMVMEQKSRGRSRYYAVGARTRLQESMRLGGLHAWLASAFCALPVLLGFIVPVAILLRLMLGEETLQLSERYLGWFKNSILLASITAVIAIVICVLLAYAARVTKSRLQAASNRVVSMGYAVPGAVIAVGILIPLARLDAWASEHGVKMLLTGSVAALVYAYLVRFLAVSYQTVQAGLVKITPTMDASARVLGHGLVSMLAKVHAPLLWRSVVTAGLLVFVDVIKELPATLTIRPFNFDTLAVITYQLAADERLGEAALPAFTIVMIALIPVGVLARSIAKAER